MTKILIVEGNSAEIINKKRKNGLPLGSDKYREALELHAPDAIFEVGVPHAVAMEDRETRIEDFDAFALTGSGVEWSSGDPRAKSYLDYLERVLDSDKPVIGSCWGMQTVVQLKGGDCLPNEKGAEVGLAKDIQLTAKGRKHWLFHGMPDVFDSPCIHRDHVVRLPDSFDLLAKNDVSTVQAVAYNRDDLDYVGFQFHPEFDLEYVEGMHNAQGLLPGTKGLVSSFPDEPSEFVTDVNLRTKVFANWIAHVQRKSDQGLAA